MKLITVKYVYEPPGLSIVPETEFEAAMLAKYWTSAKLSKGKLLGHYQMSHVIHTLDKYLNYHWCAILPNRNQPIMHGWNIKVCWKPILIYTKGKPRAHPLMLDNFGIYANDSQSWRDAKAVHEWGQSTSSVMEPIKRLTVEGDLILGEHQMPDSWECVQWKARGGYGSQGDGRGRENAARERIWFSPHCLHLQESLFSIHTQGSVPELQI